MRVFRIAYQRFARDPLSGEGSFLYGGRWSSRNVRVAYTSTCAALAMLEFLAHVSLDDFDSFAPPPLVMVAADLGSVPLLHLDEIGAVLPTDWDAVPAPAECALIGDNWVRSMKSVTLAVPSVHTPIRTPERVVLINPVHPDFASVRVEVERFSYDARIIRRPGRHK